MCHFHISPSCSLAYLIHSAWFSISRVSQWWKANFSFHSAPPFPQHSDVFRTYDVKVWLFFSFICLRSMAQWWESEPLKSSSQERRLTFLWNQWNEDYVSVAGWKREGLIRQNHAIDHHKKKSSYKVKLSSISSLCQTVTNIKQQSRFDDSNGGQQRWQQ